MYSDEFKKEGTVSVPIIKTITADQTRELAKHYFG